MSLTNYYVIECPIAIEAYKKVNGRYREWLKAYNTYAKEKGFLFSEFHNVMNLRTFSRSFRRSLFKEKNNYDEKVFKTLASRTLTYRASEKEGIAEMERLIEKVGLTFDLMDTYRALLKDDLEGFSYNKNPICEVRKVTFEGVERILICAITLWDDSESWTKPFEHLKPIKKSEYYRLLGE